MQIVPSDIRLLNGARRTLAQLATGTAPEIKPALDAIDVTLTELLLRADRTFYAEHYAEGLGLVKTGISLANAQDRGALSDQTAALPPINDQNLLADLAWERIDFLRKALEGIVRALSVPGLSTSRDAGAYLASIVDWENRFYVRHPTLMAKVPAGVGPTAEPFSGENLEAYFRWKFPEWKNMVVSNVKVLVGGFSKKTILLDVTDEIGGKRSWVIRAQQPTNFGFWEGDQVENEYPTLQLVHGAGLPVAKPLWLEQDKRYIGNKFLVSEKADGQTIGSSVGAGSGISKGMLAEVIRELVRIHGTRLNLNDERIQKTYLKSWADHKTLTQSTSAWVAHWLESIREKQLRPSPLTVRVMEWLRNNVPQEDVPPALLHGDFGLHNVLFTGEKVSCILDWEYLTFGDPAEDIAMLAIGLTGTMSKAEIMALYTGFGGRPISEFRLCYFDVLWTLKFIATCERSLKLFEEYEAAGIELCKLGLQFPYAAVGTLNEKIARAEQARDGA